MSIPGHETTQSQQCPGREVNNKNPHLDQIDFPTLLHSLGTRRLPPGYPGGNQRRSSPNIPAKKEKEKNKRKHGFSYTPCLTCLLPTILSYYYI
jgi:hypothetical protein